MKSRVHPKFKTKYHVGNWPAYERALINRGSSTFWFTDEAINKWTAPASGKPGGQRKYSNLAIETALAFRMVFHLPWRQTKGCLQSELAPETWTVGLLNSRC